VLDGQASVRLLRDAPQVFALVVNAPERPTGQRVVVAFESASAAQTYARRHPDGAPRLAVLDFDTTDPPTTQPETASRETEQAPASSEDPSADSGLAAPGTAALMRRGDVVNAAPTRPEREGSLTPDEHANTWARTGRRLLAEDAARGHAGAVPLERLRRALRTARTISLAPSFPQPSGSAYELGGRIVAAMIHTVASGALTHDANAASGEPDHLRAALVTILSLEPIALTAITPEPEPGPAFAFDRGARSIINAVRVAVSRTLASTPSGAAAPRS
jgi:hypothetical protein